MPKSEKPAPKKSPAPRKPAPKDGPEFYFDSRRNCYWFRDDVRGEFYPLNDGKAKLELRSLGFGDHKTEGDLNPCERELHAANKFRRVDCAGPLAGHRIGLRTLATGERWLVTNEAPGVFEKPTAPYSANHWQELFDFIFALLGDEQGYNFLLWLKWGLLGLIEGDFRLGQCLAFCGPPQCGKNFVQFVISEFFGGRVGAPFEWMMGQTPFNAELAGAEHWAIADKLGGFDIRTRKRFASEIKSIVSDTTIRIHGKGKQAGTADTFRRLTISLNQENEALHILPPIDEDFEDKISLYLCAPAAKFIPQDRNRAAEMVRRCVPHLRSYVWRMKMDAKLTDHRFGVSKFHHPELLELLRETSPETRLLEILDNALWTAGDAMPAPVNGTAAQIQEMIYGTSLRSSAEKVLERIPNACGTYLGRLAKKFPERFAHHKTMGKTVWTIKAPDKSEGAQQGELIA
jgi:hypothetical protein